MGFFSCVASLKGTFPTKLFIFMIFLLTSFVINFTHLILLTLIRPLSKRLYFWIVQYINWTFIAQAVFFYEHWSNSEIIFHCKQSDYEALKHEKVFVITNHSHDIDILLWMVIMNHFQKLGNDICYAKDFVKHIPFIGWHIYLSQHIRLKLCYEEDKKTIETRFRDIAANGSDVWVVFMPEGPRLTKERHAESIKFALDRNLQPLMHHLVPKSKGFAVSYEALRQQGYKTIVNAQIAFDAKKFAQPKFSSMMQCRKMQAHVYFERIPFDSIEPTFDGIYKMFKSKDELHESFIERGNFNKNGNLKKILMQNHKSILINFICWSALWMVVTIVGGYSVIVHLYYKDMQNYSNLVTLVRIACDIHDYTYIYLRPILY
ncbi:hypothetical protein ACKWTF_013139 [Chironomus riparius]